MNFEAKDIIEIVAFLIGGIFSYAKLQNGQANNKEAIADIRKEVEKLDAALEKTKERNEIFYNEVRAVTLGIQKALSRVEGRLAVSIREDRDE